MCAWLVWVVSPNIISTLPGSDYLGLSVCTGWRGGGGLGGWQRAPTWSTKIYRFDAVSKTPLSNATQIRAAQNNVSHSPPPPNAPNPQPISICPHRRLLFDRAGELGLIPGPCMWHRREQEEDTQQRVEFGQCRRKKGRRGGGWLMTTIQKFACNSPCIWFSQCCAQSLYAFISSNTYCSSVVCRSLSPSLCCICTTH